MTITELEFSELLAQAKAMARPLVSDYSVGAIAIAESGKAYLGCNLEFPNQPLSQTVHAEQFAIVLARLHGETGIQKLVVSEAPCGHCRQFMLEMGKPALPITVMESDRTLELTLADLLPYPFTLHPGALGLMHQTMQPFSYTQDPNLKPVASDALEAVCRSYAPYTQGYAGVAIRTESDTIYTGSLLESAAYNPTVPALQAALIDMVASGEPYDAMREVLLVEAEGAPDTASSTFWALAKALSPMTQVEFATVCKKY